MSLSATLETIELIDLLAQNTQRLSELLSQRNLGNEYQERKKLIVALQQEIERRKNSPACITTNSVVAKE